MAQQRRTMAGGHAPAPKWEGIDKVVRDVFPEDWQSELLFVGQVHGGEIARDSRFRVAEKCNTHA
jgi:hypothetical protein